MLRQKKLIKNPSNCLKYEHLNEEAENEKEEIE